jgi:hypothetical protein
VVTVGLAVQRVITVCLSLCLWIASTATQAEAACSSDAVAPILAVHAPNIDSVTARFKKNTLIVELGKTGESWKGLLTFNHAEGTVYTSVGGEKLTPDTRSKLQRIVESCAKDPALRNILKTCASTSAAQAEGNSRGALEDALRADREEAPEPSDTELRAAFYITGLLPFLWGLFLLTGLICLARRWRFDRKEATILGVIVLFGLVLRALVPAWGPGDISITTEGVQSGADHFLNFGHYGRGVEGLLLLVGPFLGASEDTLVHLNLVAGLATLPVLYAFAMRLGYGRLVGRTAALFLALAPLHIRFSPTYNRYILLLFLMLLGWTMLLAFLAQRRRSDLLLGFLSLVLAAQCRPEAAVLPFASMGLCLVLLANPETREQLKASTGWLVAAVVLLALLLIEPLSAVLETAGAHDRWVTEYAEKQRPLFDPEYNVFLSPWVGVVAWVPLACVGLLTAPKGNRWLLLWIVTMALGFTAVVATRELGESHVIDARYHLSALPFYLLLSASGAATVGRWLDQRLNKGAGWVTLASVLLMSAGAFTAMPSAAMRTTMNQEYDFVRHHLPSVPEACTIVAYEPDFDLGLRAPFHLSPTLGLDHEWLLTRERPRERLATDTCMVYYHTASCSTVTDVLHDQRGQADLCASMLQSHKGAIAEAQLSSLPAGAYRYKEAKVPVGFYWLVKP